MAKYLDSSGLSYLWGKIKASFAAKSHSHAAGDITSGTLGAARGGTGETTLQNAANALINALGTGSASITNDDVYIITENNNATEDKYYRRPVSKLWDYMKSKADSVYAALSHSHDNATQSAAGFMSSGDKTKLDKIAAYDNTSLRLRTGDQLHSILLTSAGNIGLYEVKTAESDSWTNVGFAAINSASPRATDQKAANKVLATPNGSSGIPTMRALVAADLPDTYVSATTSRTANRVLASPNGSNGAPSFRALSINDIDQCLSPTQYDISSLVSQTSAQQGNFTINSAQLLVSGYTAQLRIGYYVKSALTANTEYSICSIDKTVSPRIGAMAGISDRRAFATLSGTQGTDFTLYIRPEAAMSASTTTIYYFNSTYILNTRYTG
jgi:hypothetical protein